METVKLRDLRVVFVALIEDNLDLTTKKYQIRLSKTHLPLNEAQRIWRPSFELLPYVVVTDNFGSFIKYLGLKKLKAFLHENVWFQVEK